jgi:hypothetical protein
LSAEYNLSRSTARRQPLEDVRRHPRQDFVVVMLHRHLSRQRLLALEQAEVPGKRLVRGAVAAVGDPAHEIARIHRQSGRLAALGAGDARIDLAVREPGRARLLGCVLGHASGYGPIGAGL